MHNSSHSPGKQRRVSLSKHKQEIEQWLSQGCSDEWIADALGTSRASVQSFRSRNGLLRRDHERRSPRKRAVSADEPVSLFEGVLDQGEEGYGLWLDPAVADDPLFREGFSTVTDIQVIIEPDRIVLEPAPSSEDTPDTASADSGAEAPATNTLADLVEVVDGAGSTSGGSGPASVNGRSPGRVKFFDASRGFGFLTLPEGEELFFHRSAIEGGEELEPGEFVFYETGSTQRGPAATKVRAAG